jgi:hypothetical protein
MIGNLPKKPFNNLAISFSGGGYRAVSFHLGVLTYLSSIEFEEVSLLERIKILSTVSGGTITGVKYATSQSIETTYSDLYKFITEFDLIGSCIEKLTNNSQWGDKKCRSLINAASLVYFEHLEGGTFSSLFENSNFHLKEIIFNATEFKYGLPFRFQKSVHSDYQHAYLGNRQVNMDLEVLKEIRLADIISASSCFPLGFEPINFPDDFKYNGSLLLDELKQSKGKDTYGNLCQFPIGLMDGGIVDNQGVDSVIWAEERMRSYPDDLKYLISDDIKAIDLFIISDVSSPYMKGFVKSENIEIPFFGNWCFNTLKFISISCLIVGLFSFIALPIIQSKIGLIIASVSGTVLITFSIFTGFLSNGFLMILKRLGVPPLFVKKLQTFNSIKFNVYYNLLINRLNSSKAMISEVFMKQLRRFAFDKVYKDNEWESRLITNAVYELTSKNVEIRNNPLNKKVLNDSILNPSELLKEVAENAYSMDTTLWFTYEQLETSNKFNHNMPDCLIACGQFTICFNLIEYIEKKLYVGNSESNYIDDEKIKSLHKRLMSDWDKFNMNPFWMVDDLNKQFA